MLEQSELNEDMTKLGVGRYRNKIESAKAREAELQTQYGQRLMRASLPKLYEGIKDWQKSLTNPNKARYQIDCLELDPKVIGFISIKAILDSISQKKPLCGVAHYLGARIEDEVRCQFLLDNNPSKGKGIILGAVRRKGEKQKIRHVRSSMKHEADKGLMEGWEKWAHRDKLNMGLQMTELVRVCTGIIEYVYILGSGKKRPTRYVAPTKETMEWIENYNEYKEFIEPFWLPTVELPKNWTNVWDGGYDHDDTSLPKVPFIKTPNMEYLRGIEGALPEPMEACNLIQQTPWSVNETVLSSMQWCWENNLVVGGLPSREHEELPPTPIDFKTNKEANTEWRRMAAKIYRGRVATMSRRLLVTKILYIAEKLVGNRFFYPSHVDFRGRIYNIPAFLGIQGPDISRGLIQFNRPEKIKTDEDVKWLAIQGANTFGNDKFTLDKRVDFAHEYSDTAIKIAKEPTQNLEWTEADEPFQFLAWCIEWATLKNTGKLNSQLPVNMDASNNGLQILSMLMRDEYGAHATNVLDTDKPEDLYRVVSDKVIEKLKEDDTDLAHKWLAFGIDRKLAKRPTMVFPYGGTFYSCRAYVDEWYQDQLKSKKMKNPFTETERYKVTGYLSRHTWNSINEVLDKPTQCMNWLKSVAKLIAKENKGIEWLTPTGFPVVQDYKKTIAQTVTTKIGGTGTHIKWHAESDNISSKKAQQGISPNFVHSLDAAALTKSVIRAHQEGIYDFAMIHDSYGTHANNCDVFSRVLREEYFSIFSVDLLHDFLRQVSIQHPNIEFPEIPAYGNADLTEVLKSTYFFS